MHLWRKQFFIISSIRVHRLFISHISRPKMLTLEYHLMLSKQLAADKLLKKTYMTHLFSFMNYTMLVLPLPHKDTHNCWHSRAW